MNYSQAVMSSHWNVIRGDEPTAQPDVNSRSGETAEMAVSGKMSMDSFILLEQQHFNIIKKRLGENHFRSFQNIICIPKFYH